MFEYDLCVYVLIVLGFFSSFRDTVTSIQESLVRATYVAKSGNPDPQNVTDWVNISCK